MPRMRLGVALLVPGPAAAEVDALRRALGDGALGRIPAHLTLVPPVNVPVDRLPEALGVLRAAAAASTPLRLRLGPPATFHPVTPVVYLAVGGDAEGVVALRDRVFRPPLARALTHPFVPHVTLADELAPERIPAALAALADARLDVTVDRLHLLREEREETGRVWRPIADAPLGPAPVVGRGGLPLELTVGVRPDPEAARLLAWSLRVPGEPPAAPTPVEPPVGPPDESPAGAGPALATSAGPAVGEPGAGELAVGARRDGELVGAAHGWTVGPVTHLAWLAVAEGARRQGVGGRLLAAVESEARTRGSAALEAVAPETPDATALLAGAGWRPTGTPAPGWRRWHRPLG